MMAHVRRIRMAQERRREGERRCTCVCILVLARTHTHAGATHIAPCPLVDQQSCCMQARTHGQRTSSGKHTHFLCTNSRNTDTIRAWLDVGQWTWDRGHPQGSLSTSDATRFAVSWPMVESMLRIVLYFLASSRHPKSLARYRFVNAFSLVFFVLVMWLISK